MQVRNDNNGNVDLVIPRKAGEFAHVSVEQALQKIRDAVVSMKETQALTLQKMEESFKQSGEIELEEFDRSVIEFDQNAEMIHFRIQMDRGTTMRKAT